MLPAGTYYTFHADNNEPLVMLRTRTLVDADKNAHGRQTIDGEEITGSSTANNAVPTVFKPGAFFR